MENEGKSERYSYGFEDNIFFDYTETMSNEKNNTEKKEPNKIKIPLLIAGIIAISLTIIAIILTTRKERENTYAIEFNRYCFKTNFTGFDSVGVVSLELDMSEIESVAMEVIEKTVPQNVSTVDKLIMAEELYDEFETGLTITTNQYENLIEGQFIEVKINADEDFLDEHGISLKENKFKVQVQGLSKLAKVDLFEQLRVDLEKIGEDAYEVELNYPDGRYEFYEKYFSVSADIVYIDESFKVSIEESKAEELVKVGIRVVKTEETYKVAELIK